MKPIETVLDKLKSVGSDPQETGSGWQSRCPAHPDDRASLSIGEGDNGRALLKCHAGCKTQAVVAKLGLTMSDLSPVHGRAVEAIYQYRDAQNEVVYEKIRYHGKKFVLRRSDGEGGDVWGIKAGWYKKHPDGWKPIRDARDPKTQPSVDARWFPEVARHIYREPSIIAAVVRGETILWVEGEKDCDNGERLGFQATTSGSASEGWRKEFGESVRGAKLVFIPDADDAGRKLFENYAPELAKTVREIRRLDLPDGAKDLSEWIEAGHTKEELRSLIDGAPLWTAEGPQAEILDSAPEAVRRPLSLVGGRGYAAAWVPVRQGDEDSTCRVVVRDDGQLFSPVLLLNALPFDQLEVKLDLPHVPLQDHLWSGAAVKRFVNGERPDPAETFGRVRRIVDHFMDFGRSLGSQELMTDLVALYALATYFLDAFSVVGYLWVNGDKGAGKTKNLTVIADLSYLGMLVLAGGSYASLRDLADYGACLAFDDAENIMDLRRTDPDKRTLLLAGNRKGTYITLKELRGREWFVRNIHAFCPRLFSAIRLPDDVLASRTIMIPLVRSSDGAKANRDPADHGMWPVERRRLVDDLWALGLANLPTLRKYDRMVVDRVTLVGRNLEPWRSILAVALWLQEEGHVPGLFDRINDLAMHYQTERGDLEEASPVRILILALQAMIKDTDALVFPPSELANAMNQLATDLEVEHTGDTFTNSKRVGLLLRRLRFARAERSANHKQWQVTRADLDALARAYAMPGLPVPPAMSEKPAVANEGASACQDAKSAVDAEMQDAPTTTPYSADETGNEASTKASEPTTGSTGAAPNDLNWN